MYVRDPYYTKILRDKKMTIWQFIGGCGEDMMEKVINCILGNTGGLIGLCLGFSFLSLVELVYHSIILLCAISSSSRG